MAGNNILSCLFVIVFAAVLDGQTLGGPTHGKVVVCYVATWAVYRPEPGDYNLDRLDPALCTHLVYSFAGLDEDTSAIKSLDAWQDLDSGKNGFNRIVALKVRYPHLKVTIAIGGWNEGSAKYSRMAQDPDKRAKFVKSVLHFLEMFKFDGLDLDWEYPSRRDGQPQDKENYVLLIKELKEAFEPHGYILTAAIGAGKDTIDAAYDLPKLSKYLDLIHLMCYDYHGNWDGVVGSNAPLKGLNEKDVLSVEYTIKYLLSHNVSPYKMVLGLPMYGRNFILKNPTAEVVFGETAALSGKGFKGPFTREDGFMGYNEICMELSNKSSRWVEYWHEQSSTPYVRDNERVMSYDNGRSIALKVKMAIDYGLGGLMVWSIDTDDFRGNCQVDINPYVDYIVRHRRINSMGPILNIVLDKLNLPDGSRRDTISRRTAYVIDNGKLDLRLPERVKTNYHLMRTINEAITLSMEEKKIEDEIERTMKENEIDTEDEKPNGASYFASSSLIGAMMTLLVLYRL